MTEHIIKKHLIILYVETGMGFKLPISTRKGDDNILSVFALFTELTLLAQSNALHFYALSILYPEVNLF